jgi:hypothetical protein
MMQQYHLLTGIVALLLSFSALIASLIIYPLTRILPEQIGISAFFLLGSTVIVGGLFGILFGLIGVNGPRHTLHQLAIRSGSASLVLLILLYMLFTTVF